MSIGLVLGTGGRNGAFAAGALYRLTSEYNMKFSAVSGASTGALMTSFAALDEIELLNDLYRGSIAASDILDERSLLFGFLKGSLADNTPLKNLINRYISKEKMLAAWHNNIKSYVTVVNMRTGLKEIHSNSPDDVGLWNEYVLASAAIPILMDPVVINGDEYVDGGLRDHIPIEPLLKDDSITQIIVISNKPLESQQWAKNPVGIKERLLRAIDIMSDEIAINDLPLKLKCRLYFKELILITPERHLGDALDFDPSTMEKIWLEGFDQANLMPSFSI